MISFQVSHLAQDGIGEIYVVVNGIKSNSLHFTVRDGKIYYVKTSGNDDYGTGSWDRPWKTINKSVNSINSGDIVYINDGVNESLETDASACVNLSSDGGQGNPKALVVYPGAKSTVGSNLVERSFYTFNPSHENSHTIYWVLAKFNIITPQLGLPARTGFRVIGNYITAPSGDGMDGAIDCDGNDIFVLGNELYDVGKLNCDKLYHTIYVKGLRQSEGPRAPTEKNREIAWNYIHDCKSNRGINIYSEQEFSAFIESHKIHDNVIVNQRGDGIMLGYYVTGNNWVFNNLLIRAGLGPNWSDPTYHCGMHFSAGHEEVNNTNIYLYNNTLYECGFSGSFFPGESGTLLFTPESISMSTVYHLSNNIIFSKGEPYIAGESADLPQDNYLNCWYGDGSAPAWDMAAINVNPNFVNESSNDLRLKESSPCINNGLDISTVVKRDLLGYLRPNGAFDLGVYEYNPSTSFNNHHEFQNIITIYLNPFSESTKINYQLSIPRRVKIDIYNSLGSKITTLVDEWKEAGNQSATFDADNLPQGMYYYTIRIGERTESGKLLLYK